MFDHIGIVVRDLESSKAFYTKILTAIGYELVQDNVEDGTGWLVFGTGESHPFFVVSAGRPTFWREQHQVGSSPIHCSFYADSKEDVVAFHQQGLMYGGTDNGGPGDRGRGYYSAYLIDLDGNNIEAGYREKVK